MRSSEPHEGLTICRAKVVPSLSHLHYAGICTELVLHNSTTEKTLLLAYLHAENLFFLPTFYKNIFYTSNKLVLRNPAKKHASS